MTSIQDQPPPIERRDLRSVWALVIGYLSRTLRDRVGLEVIEDAHDRNAVGTERYGVPLTCGNGRDHLVDAYQEALDLAVYLATELEERGLWSVDGEVEFDGGALDADENQVVVGLFANAVRACHALRAMISERDKRIARSKLPAMRARAERAEAELAALKARLTGPSQWQIAADAAVARVGDGATDETI